MSYHQILFPKHLITEPLKAIHGQMGKHPRITKVIQECKSKYYLPGLAKRFKQWVLQCEDCIKYKRINNNQSTPKMFNNTEHVLGPEDILETDILSDLPNSAGYWNIVTTSRYKSRSGQYKSINNQQTSQTKSNISFFRKKLSKPRKKSCYKRNKRDKMRATKTRQK